MLPKLLSEDQKKKRVRICTEFVAAVRRGSMAMLDNIVMMDETMVSYHTPKAERQLKQWIKKGLPGPVKAKVAGCRTKQMMVVFFDKKGLVYTHIVPRGITTNANYTIIVLGKFLKHLRNKRPGMVEQEWFLHWDNAPVHTAPVVKNWLAARSIQVLSHPPNLPGLAPADFFLFRKVKEELDGLHLTQETHKSTWERVIRTSPKMSLLSLSGAGSSAVKSVSASAVTMSRKVQQKNKHLSNSFY
jgi:histone-lysine N-methyltransferase SETMAR